MQEYITEKKKILKQMHITLTQEQKQHLNGLKTEIAIDNFCHDIIFGVDSCFNYAC